jgi:hypothetical protein
MFSGPQANASSVEEPHVGVAQNNGAAGKDVHDGNIACTEIAER